MDINKESFHELISKETKPDKKSSSAGKSKDETGEEKGFDSKGKTKAELLYESILLEDLRKKRIDNKALLKTIEPKGKIFNWISWLAPFYLAFTLLIVVSSKWTQLSDAVLITLLTTAMAYVMALPSLMIKSLFPDNNKIKT